MKPENRARELRTGHSETRDMGDRIAKAKREVRSRSHDGIERRTVRAKVEVRADANGNHEFSGHAAVYNDLSEDLGFYETWYERIAEGAFDSVLRKNPDVRALFNHDPNLALARTTAKGEVGWLELSTDDTGLAYRFVPTPTTYAADLRANVDAEVVNQSSFAFRVARKGDSWEEDDEGNLVRTIHQFSELYDVSPVTYPAYPTTDVGVSSGADREDDEQRDDDLEGDVTPDSDLEAEVPTEQTPEVEQGSGNGTDTAPEPERAADEGTSPSAADDGGDEDEEADEPQANEGAGSDGAHALNLRKRRMKAMQAMGLAPDAKST